MPTGSIEREELAQLTAQQIALAHEPGQRRRPLGTEIGPGGLKFITQMLALWGLALTPPPPPPPVKVKP